MRPLTKTVDILLRSLRTDYIAPSNVLLKPEHNGVEYIKRSLPAVNQYTGGNVMFQRRGMPEEIIKDGEGVLIRSDFTYRTRNLSPGTTRRRGIAFRFSMMGGADPLDLLDTPFILDKSTAEDIASVSRNLFTTIESTDFLRVAAGKAELGMRLFSKIVSISKLKPDAETRVECIERLQKVFNYIQDHFEEQIGIEKLARLAGLSSSRFYTVFQYNTGISPKQYILNMRLARAQELLTGNLPISEIAELTGFQEQYYFSRLFRKKLGLSPSRFRIENRLG